jgi:acetoacetate decarboxylase
MKAEDILKLTSMPMSSPSYPKGPYRFINREYFIIAYESDPQAIREALPEPLEPDGSNMIMYEFISMPDSTGFGSYSESGLVIPCLYKGEHVNYTAQMYLDCEPPIAAGREVWGFPKKRANPKLRIVHDTLTGTLENLISSSEARHKADVEEIIKKITKTQVNLKLIPDVDGSLVIAQLVAYNVEEVALKGAWKGQARLHLVPHVNAPVADLPVKKMIGGTHFITDLTLPYGRVLHDYLK